MGESKRPVVSDQRIKALQGTPTFGGMEADAIRYLLEQGQMRFVPAGQYLYRSGDRGDSVYLVDSGELEVQRERAQAGSERQSWHFGEGDFFGDLSLIALRPRACSALALTDSRVLEIDARAIHDFYQHDNKQYTILLMNISRNFSRMLMDQREN